MNVESPDLVSVIVPFLNGSDWLVDALQSVFHQTYTHWELIVINDGSEEKHSAVAKAFCSLHPDKILYTEHEEHKNKGVSISRNKAAELARGKYLAFLDADDLWLPGKLALQIAHFASHPQAEVVCQPIIKWYSWQHENKQEDYIQPVGVPAGICYAPGTLIKLLYPLQDAAPPAPSGIMITKEAFEKAGGFEPTFSGIYELYEDQAFLSKVYLQAHVFISPAANVMYRKRNNSMSAAAADEGRYYTVRAFYLDWLEDYLRKNKVTDNNIFLCVEAAKKKRATVE